jgi:alpha-D-ribose 1-methylphosphonate 5-triphosphate synthase subunit PhnH
MRPGFDDPVRDSQRVFRRVLEAMAHPGRIVTVDALDQPPPPLVPAAAAMMLALIDFETPLWLDAPARSTEAADWLRFHCGVPVVDDPAAARFALCTAPDAMPALGAFDAGTDAMPDRSATLVLQVETLVADAGAQLTGPGIAETARLDVRGGPRDFWDVVRDNGTRFPRGVDFVLVAGARLAALPRTVRVETD